MPPPPPKFIDTKARTSMSLEDTRARIARGHEALRSAEKRRTEKHKHRKAQAESGRVQRSNGARLKNRKAQAQKSTSRIWTNTTQQ